MVIPRAGEDTGQNILVYCVRRASPVAQQYPPAWVWKIPWRRAWQPTPVFLPGKSHGQRSLMGYSPWVHKRVGDDFSD